MSQVGLLEDSNALEDRLWHAFEDKFSTLRFQAFESWVSDILRWAVPDFLPTGVGRDFGCDGLRTKSGELFQVYAPARIDTAKLNRKIREDFAKALANWRTEMRKWVFVCNTEEAVPPKTVQLIGTLQAANPDVTIAFLGKIELWKIVRRIEDGGLRRLFPEIYRKDTTRRVFVISCCAVAISLGCFALWGKPEQQVPKEIQSPGEIEQLEWQFPRNPKPRENDVPKELQLPAELQRLEPRVPMEIKPPGEIERANPGSSGEWPAPQKPRPEKDHASPHFDAPPIPPEPPPQPSYFPRRRQNGRSSSLPKRPENEGASRVRTDN